LCVKMQKLCDLQRIILSHVTSSSLFARLPSMNVVREINRINERELDLNIGASWHDDYKDSAYIFFGGLSSELTEGDVITIFSQYGEVADVNLPRDKETRKSRGFGFLMYEDQRSTVLAVDNLNGAVILGRAIRVDHVKNYKQKRVKNENGEWVEPEEQSLNAKPQLIGACSLIYWKGLLLTKICVIDDEGAASDSSGPDIAADIDPEDPMRDYIIAQRREERASKKSKKRKSKGKHKDETPEERRARKEKKQGKRNRKLQEKSEGVRNVEQLLRSLDRRREEGGHRSVSPRRDSQ